MQFKSPWLEFERKHWPTLAQSSNTDIAIIGGGISGVVALYFLLQNTDKKIVLLEKDRIASGATGNNAALAVAAFEVPLSELIDNYGETLVKQAYQDLHQGWQELLQLLAEIKQSDALQLFDRCKMGMASMEAFLARLELDILNNSFNPSDWQYYVSDEPAIKSAIPSQYHAKINFVGKQKILTLLGSSDDNYFACLLTDHYQVGRLNSAKLCYDLLDYLEQKFPDRFHVFEQTEIQKINLAKDQCELMHVHGKLHANQVILCTNAYTDFDILDQEKQLPLLKLKQQVSQVEGLMGGFIEENLHKVVAAFFCNDEQKLNDLNLFYINRAHYNNASALTIIGGPEHPTLQIATAEKLEQAMLDSVTAYRNFLKTIDFSFNGNFDYLWHGTMGYTSNKIRWVGQDPDYAQLIYNIGCNGIGIIPAIFSGRKIASIINHEPQQPSIFDPT